MRTRRQERGNALLVSVIVVLVMTVASVGVIRYASREVAGATAAKRQAALASCAEAARVLLMSEWKVLGTPGPDLPALNVTVDDATPTQVLGGHYGDVGVTKVQVIKLNPLTVGSFYQANDLTNKITDQVQPYRVVVHCRQGSGVDARELEVEFGVSYGL